MNCIFQSNKVINLNKSDLPIDLSCDSSFIVPSVMVCGSLDMTCANDSCVETLPKEFLSLCAQAFEQEVEIMHLNVSSNKDFKSSHKSHMGEDVEESLGENFALDNMLIDDGEVESLVSDAIESYDITSCDCVSPSPLIHSPPIERESSIEHPNFVHEECHSKSIWEREVDALELMLKGDGVYDEETLALVNSFDTEFLHLETSSCFELFLAEEERCLMVASSPLIHKSTIEFVNTDFIADNYIIDKLSCYSLLDHDPSVLNWSNAYAFPECVARLSYKSKRALTFISVAILLSNYLYHLSLNFSKEFDKMLRALTMSNLEPS